MAGGPRTSELEGLRARVAQLEGQLEACGGCPRRGIPFGEALAEREALLSEAERIAHMGSWTWDLLTDTIQWSDEFRRILGLALETPPSAEAFFGALHPEDLPRVQANSQRGLETGSPERVEFRVVRPDGQERLVSMDAAVVTNADGQPTRFVGTVVDVTEPRTTQKLLQRTVQELNDAQRIAALGSFSLDPQTGAMEWSLQLRRLLAYGGEVVPSRAQLTARVFPEDRHAFDALLAQTIEASRPGSLELRLLMPDGSLRHGQLELRVADDESHRRYCIFGTLLDVTGRKLLEEQLRHSQKMEAVGTLAGGVAHEFNNYLHVMAGHAELAQDSLDCPEQTAKHLRVILESCDRSQALTKQLLTFSRKQASRPSAVDVEQLTSQVAHMLQQVVGTHIEFTTRCAGELPCVLADASRLEQVLVNLALNARDAMPGGGSLRIEADSALLDADSGLLDDHMQPGEYVCLSVEDTGTGMAPEVRARIFEPFFSTKQSGRGTGLGLSMVYGIVRQSGGVITVDSQPGEGTTFRVYLPVTHEAQRAAPLRKAMGSGAPRMRRVLVVEDGEEVRRLVCAQLEASGYAVRAAHDGQQALEMVRGGSGEFDLVLSDVVMPRMGGVPLAAALRRERPGLPVLFMSGHAASELPSVLDAPLLNKPFTRSELLSAIEEVVRSAEAEAAAG